MTVIRHQNLSLAYWFFTCTQKLSRQAYLRLPVDVRLVLVAGEVGERSVPGRVVVGAAAFQLSAAVRRRHLNDRLNKSLLTSERRSCLRKIIIDFNLGFVCAYHPAAVGSDPKHTI